MLVKKIGVEDEDHGMEQRPMILNTKDFTGWTTVD